MKFFLTFNRALQLLHNLNDDDGCLIWTVKITTRIENNLKS